ncbi:hypothetical protein [Streptomyces sp. NBC_01716]|uniref:hypothetical protein n=1 Tax=Streptomyces sp. NBC_01716 TaxID=2975917 RepID=UPI002E358553|nr:hypothetical protein [Streptomyces sp. NBC_01716]
MRSHVSSRAAAAVVCAVLVMGTAGTAAAVTVQETPVGVGAKAVAPIADAEALKQQTQTLSSLSGAIKPVTDLLDSVIAADNGQISAAEVQRYQKAIRKALNAVQNAAPAAPAKPAGHMGDMDATNGMGADDKAQAAADLRAEAVDSVRRATDALLRATTARDANAVATQSKAVVTSLVNLTTALVMNGGLPAPNLPGLPELPQLPEAGVPAPAPELPGVPSTPQLP